MSQKPRILFVSRAWPPVIGGIERQNFELAHALAALTDVSIIANPHGKKFLPIFMLTSFVRAMAKVRHADVVLLGDGVLAVWGLLLKRISRRPVCSIIHGLDVTYPSPVYQKFWVRLAMNRLDALFAVGNATIEEAVERGVDRERCHFIPNGTLVFRPPRAGDAAAKATGGADAVRLLTLGRLVERKGVVWFVAEVLPRLPDNVRYTVAGDGPDRRRLEDLIRERGLEGRVTVTGTVSDEEKDRLLVSHDIFVQPNVPVPGDMEGFGLVVLEAGAAGMTVVASNLEGLADAIDDGANGLLVEAGNSDAWVECLDRLVSNPNECDRLGARAQQYIEAHCLWHHVAAQYLAQLAAIPVRG